MGKNNFDQSRRFRTFFFYVTAASEPGLVVCSFAKPSWNADHCSKPMEHGAEAIVMAVCEYLNGE